MSEKKTTFVDIGPGEKVAIGDTTIRVSRISPGRVGLSFRAAVGIEIVRAELLPRAPGRVRRRRPR